MGTLRNQFICLALLFLGSLAARADDEYHVCEGSKAHGYIIDQMEDYKNYYVINKDYGVSGEYGRCTLLLHEFYSSTSGSKCGTKQTPTQDPQVQQAYNKEMTLLTDSGFLSDIKAACIAASAAKNITAFVGAASPSNSQADADSAAINTETAAQNGNRNFIAALQQVIKDINNARNQILPMDINASNTIGILDPEGKPSQRNLKSDYKSEANTFWGGHGVENGKSVLYHGFMSVIENEVIADLKKAGITDAELSAEINTTTAAGVDALKSLDMERNLDAATSSTLALGDGTSPVIDGSQSGVSTNGGDGDGAAAPAGTQANNKDGGSDGSGSGNNNSDTANNVNAATALGNTASNFVGSNNSSGGSSGSGGGPIVTQNIVQGGSTAPSDTPNSVNNFTSSNGGAGTANTNTATTTPLGTTLTPQTSVASNDIPVSSGNSGASSSNTGIGSMQNGSSGASTAGSSSSSALGSSLKDAVRDHIANTENQNQTLATAKAVTNASAIGSLGSSASGVAKMSLAGSETDASVQDMVSNMQNLLHPDDGTAATSAALNPGAPAIGAISTASRNPASMNLKDGGSADIAGVDSDPLFLRVSHTITRCLNKGSVINGLRNKL